MERWLDTNEQEEAISALEFVLESAPRLATDIYRWRWVIISLHSALQGFMVIALRSSDGSGPVPDSIIMQILLARGAKESQPRHILQKLLVLCRLPRSRCITQILAACRAKELEPREMLHKFLVVYRLLRTRRMDRYGPLSKRFHPQGTQSHSVRRLNELRNKFIHFTPEGWLLEVSRMPHICLDCLAVIHFLESQSGNIVWKDASLHQRATDAIAATTKFFATLRDEYDNVA
jgi:hypothetical protein